MFVWIFHIYQIRVNSYILVQLFLFPFSLRQKNWLVPFPQLSLLVPLASCPFGISCHLVPHLHSICCISPPLPLSHMLTTCSNIPKMYLSFPLMASQCQLKTTKNLYSLIQHSRTNMMWPKPIFLSRKRKIFLFCVYISCGKTHLQIRLHVYLNLSLWPC